jgi:hypothetical protein
MKTSAFKFLAALLIILWSGMSYAADNAPKVVIMAFELNDLTGIPDAPEEKTRVELLSKTFKDQLKDKGVEILPPSEKAKAEITRNSPGYFFDNTDTAVDINSEANADYIVIGVALKPTYLFVYPRLLMVDAKTKKVVMSKYAQLESSWSDENTTIRTGQKLAQFVKDRLDLLQSKK